MTRIISVTNAQRREIDRETESETTCAKNPAPHRALADGSEWSPRHENDRGLLVWRHRAICIQKPRRQIGYFRHSGLPLACDSCITSTYVTCGLCVRVYSTSLNSACTLSAAFLYGGPEGVISLRILAGLPVVPHFRRLKCRCLAEIEGRVGVRRPLWVIRPHLNLTKRSD